VHKNRRTVFQNFETLALNNLQVIPYFELRQSANFARLKHNHCMSSNYQVLALSFFKQTTTKMTNDFFPWKVHEMLDVAEKRGDGAIVSWLPDGLSFRVHKRNVFIENLMKVCSKSAKFSTFRTQLQVWGFERKKIQGAAKDAFFHPLFRRGQRDLSKGMVRKRKTVKIDTLSSMTKKKLDGKKSCGLDLVIKKTHENDPALVHKSALVQSLPDDAGYLSEIPILQSYGAVDALLNDSSIHSEVFSEHFISVPKVFKQSTQAQSTQPRLLPGEATSLSKGTIGPSPAPLVNSLQSSIVSPLSIPTHVSNSTIINYSQLRCLIRVLRDSKTAAEAAECVKCFKLKLSESAFTVEQARAFVQDAYELTMIPIMNDAMKKWVASVPFTKAALYVLSAITHYLPKSREQFVDIGGIHTILVIGKYYAVNSTIVKKTVVVISTISETLPGEVADDSCADFVLKTLSTVIQEQDFILLEVGCGYLFNIGICNNRKQSLRQMGVFEVLDSVIHKSKVGAAGANARHWANMAWRRILE
jgi:hypothetical protein